MLRRLNLPNSVVRQIVRYAQRPALGGPLPVPFQRLYAELIASLPPSPAGTRYEKTVLGERPALKVTVTGRTDSRTGTSAGGSGDSDNAAVVHLHGGAYTIGSPRIYRTFAANLAELTGRPVYLPDYRLAPEHRYPAALDDALAACAAVAELHDGFALSGDSAGGGLAAATALRLAGGSAAPAALGLISPWVDLSEIPERTSDLVVRTSWGVRCAELYAGDTDRADPGLSPIYGDLSLLPRTLIQVADDEVLLEQVRRFAAGALAAGADLRLAELPKLWHVAHLHAALLAEAYQALRELAGFLTAVRDGDEPGT